MRQGQRWEVELFIMSGLGGLSKEGFTSRDSDVRKEPSWADMQAEPLGRGQ